VDIRNTLGQNGCIGYMRSIGLSHVREEPELIKVNRIIAMIATSIDMISHDPL